MLNSDSDDDQPKKDVKSYVPMKNLGSVKGRWDQIEAERKKIEEAVARGRKELTLRFSIRQARYNVQSEGGFLSTILAAATRFLPAILAGLVAGTADQDVEGNGMFLGKRDHTYQIQHAGERLLIKAVPHSKIRGFYVKHDDRIYQGRGILHELFGEIPL